MRASFASSLNFRGVFSGGSRFPFVYSCKKFVHDGATDSSPDFVIEESGNSDVENLRIAQEAEKFCQMLANHRGSLGVGAALESSSLHTNITSSLAQQVLKRLINAGFLALSFFRWTEREKGIKHTPESYHILIESLGKIKQFKMAWNLVDEMSTRGILSKESFALISRRYARARKVKEAIEAFEKMENKFGISPELQDYNRQLDVLCKSRAVESAQKLFDKWKSTRFKPDMKSYTILLEGWGRHQNLLRMDEVYREMRDHGFEPDVVAYGIIINSYCKAKKYDAAVEKYHEMESKDIKASPHIYCCLINGLGSEKRLSQALKYFELAKSNPYPLEAPTFNAVVGAYCWSMRIPEAYRVIDEMRACNVGPNSRTYDIILHHLIRAGRRQEAYAVFQKMSEEPGCEPTISTYEIIIQMFCNEKRIDMAMRVWSEMKSRGLLPGMHMFSTLINRLCREKKLDDACNYLQEMMDFGMRPPNPLFKNLKQALVDAGRKGTATSLSKMLHKRRVTQIVD